MRTSHGSDDGGIDGLCTVAVDRGAGAAHIDADVTERGRTAWCAGSCRCTSVANGATNGASSVAGCTCAKAGAGGCADG
jgi:hypothetical protein